MRAVALIKPCGALVLFLLLTISTYTTPRAEVSTLGTSAPFGQTSGPFAVSQHYEPYQDLGVSVHKQLTQHVADGQAAISFGVYNGTLQIEISQGSSTLYTGSITGPPFDYVTIAGSESFGYVNFSSDGSNLEISLQNTGPTVALFAYNLYNASISRYTASLITYPPQFAVNLTPTNTSQVGSTATPINTGMSFLVRAPRYNQPMPLAIWIGEGYYNGSTQWWAQDGFSNFGTTQTASYPGWGIFSTIFGNPGGADLSHPLIPGDTYNFTMALVANTTWAFLVNGTAIKEPGLTGFFNTTTSYANGNAILGLETLTNWGPDVNITSMIDIPITMSFRVGGVWTEPSRVQMGEEVGAGVGENWQNGHGAQAPGIALWGAEGNLQNSSVRPGSLRFGNSLPPFLPIPDSAPFGEPFSGAFTAPNAGANFGPNFVAATLSHGSIVITPKQASRFASVVFLNSQNQILGDVPVLLNNASSTSVLAGASSAEVYATSDYSAFQGLWLPISPQTTTTTTESTTSATSTTSTNATITQRTSSTFTMSSSSTQSTTTTSVRVTLTSPSPSTSGTSTTIAASSPPGGGGVPEFTYRPLAVVILTVLLAASYLLVRRNVSKRKN
jgi:hypothetical protein